MFASGTNNLSSPATNGTISHEPTVNGGTGPYRGPKRTMARRGTELFVAVGKQLRWSDLRMLKDDYEEKEKGKEHQHQNGRQDGKVDGDGDAAAAQCGYRVGIVVGIVT